MCGPVGIFLNKALLFTFHGYFFPLCFGSAALCIHYRTNTELYLLGTTQRSAAWREAVRTTTKKRGWAENWSGQLRDGRHRWWQQGSQQCVHLWDAQYCTRLKAQSAVRLKCLLHIAGLQVVGSNAYYTLLAYTTWEEEKEAIQVKLTHLFPNLKNNWDLKK